MYAGYLHKILFDVFVATGDRIARSCASQNSDVFGIDADLLTATQTCQWLYTNDCSASLKQLSVLIGLEISACLQEQRTSVEPFNLEVVSSDQHAVLV